MCVLVTPSTETKRINNSSNFVRFPFDNDTVNMRKIASLNIILQLVKRRGWKKIQSSYKQQRIARCEMRWTPCNVHTHTHTNWYGFCSFFCAYHVSRSRVLYFLFVYPLSLSLVFVLTFLKWNPWHSNTLAGVDLPNYLLSWHEIFRTLCVNCDFFPTLFLSSHCCAKI